MVNQTNILLYSLYQLIYLTEGKLKYWVVLCQLFLQHIQWIGPNTLIFLFSSYLCLMEDVFVILIWILWKIILDGDRWIAISIICIILCFGAWWNQVKRILRLRRSSKLLIQEIRMKYCLGILGLITIPFRKCIEKGQ